MPWSIETYNMIGFPGWNPELPGIYVEYIVRYIQTFVPRKIGVWVLGWVLYPNPNLNQKPKNFYTQTKNLNQKPKHFYTHAQNLNPRPKNGYTQTQNLNPKIFWLQTSGNIIY